MRKILMKKEEVKNEVKKKLKKYKESMIIRHKENIKIIRINFIKKEKKKKWSWRKNNKFK